MQGGNFMDIEKLLVKYPVVKFVDHPSYQCKKTAAKLKNFIDISKKDNSEIILNGNADKKFIQKMCRFDPLSREEEIYLFQQLNFFRYKFNLVRKKIVEGNTKTKTINSLISYYNKSIKVRNYILNCNIRLAVVFLQKRPHLMKDFMEHVSNSIVIILRAIDNFDWNFNYKFSTYVFKSLKNETKFELSPESTNKLLKNKVQVNDAFDSDLIPDKSYSKENAHREQWCDAIKTLLNDLRIKDPYAHKVIVMDKGIDCEIMKKSEICKSLNISNNRFCYLRERGLRKLRELVKNYPILMR